MSRMTVCDVCGNQRNNSDVRNVGGTLTSSGGTVDLCKSCVESVEKHIRTLKVAERAERTT